MADSTAYGIYCGATFDQLSPNALTYGAQAVATASTPQTITVTNTWQCSADGQHGRGTTGDFNETDNCAAAPIAVSPTCTIQVRFLPTATGSRSGVLTVYGNVSGGQATAALTGIGSAAAAIVLDPVALTFPSTTINATSPAQNITISNTSGSSVALQTPSVAGADFRITANTCGASLGPSTGCTVAIVSRRQRREAAAGPSLLADDAGTQSASLSGIGTSPATDALSPLALTFAPQQITTASAAQQIMLTNSGDLPLTLIAAQITSGDFTAVNACGNSLNPHSTCSINVAFQPKNVGTISGSLTISDQYRTQTVTLSGIGSCAARCVSCPFLDYQFPCYRSRCNLRCADGYID